MTKQVVCFKVSWPTAAAAAAADLRQMPVGDECDSDVCGGIQSWIWPLSSAPPNHQWRDSRICRTTPFASWLFRCEQEIEDLWAFQSTPPVGAWAKYGRRHCSRVLGPKPSPRCPRFGLWWVHVLIRRRSSKKDSPDWCWRNMAWHKHDLDMT